MSKKFGSQRHNIRRKVVRMRLKDLMSWQAIAAELDIAPRTARKLFQEAEGEGQHHDHIPGKGGRFPAGKVLKDDTVVTYLPVDGAYLPGDGSHNVWNKTELV